MKTKNTHLTVLACVMLLGSAALSHAAIIWQNNFDQYSDGTQLVQGDNSILTGWGGGWFQGNGSVIVTGGVAAGNGNVKGDLNGTFSGAVGATGTIWLSFDWGQDAANVNYGGITFFDSTNTEVGIIGNDYSGTTWRMNGATTSIPTVGMNTGVARITLNGASASTVDLWVGATGSPVDVSGAAMATASVVHLTDTRYLRIMGGDSQSFDNLVIGTTMGDVAAIPEPASLGMLGTAAAAMLLRRRLRR